MSFTPAQFFTFHQDNPELYKTLVGFAREVKKTGLRKCGMRLIWERARWFFTVEIQQPANELFKLNDWYKEYYARLIMAQEPDLKDFFDTRTSIADTMFDGEPK